MKDRIPNTEEIAKRIAPYGDTSKGIRKSKPDDNGLIQYIWRQCRFHTGADMHMPVTDRGWLKDWMESEGLIPEYKSVTTGASDEERRRSSRIRGEKVSEMEDILEDVITDVIREQFEMDDTVAAQRWSKAGLF